MSQVQQLYRLQQLDTEIKTKKQRLAEVINNQRETDELLAARGRADKVAAELRRLETEQKDQNLELGSVVNKRQRSEQRLYSGKIQNPKELADLQHEVESLAHRRSVLEDEILETMILIEEAQEEKESADQSLARITTDWQESQSRLNEEQQTLVAILGDLMAKRVGQVKLIEPDLQREYELLARQKGGIGVAGLQNGRCLGCHITASAEKIKRAERGEIVPCGGCGRILYLL